MTLTATETLLLAALALQIQTMKLAVPPGVTVLDADGYICTTMHSPAGDELGEADGDGLVVVLALVPVLAVVDAPVLALAVADALDDVLLAELVGVGVGLGEVESLEVPAIGVAVAACAVGGDEAQTVVAVVAARPTNPVKIIAAPNNAIPMIRPSAAGFRSNALTDAKPSPQSAVQDHARS